MARSEYVWSRDFYLEVQKGNIPGHSIVHKFGAAKGIGSTLTPITSSNNFPTPKTLTNLEVVSDSVNDAPAGTGLRTLDLICISDVNGSWTQQTISINLNGTTAVALPNGVYRVDRMKGTGSGTYADQATPSHNSTITLREAGGGATWHTITSEASFGFSQSEIAFFTVPKDKDGYLLSKKITIEGNKSANVYLYTRTNADIVTAPYGTMNVKELERNLQDTAKMNSKSPLLISEGATDIGFMASVNTGTSDVSVDFEILLIDK